MGWLVLGSERVVLWHQEVASFPFSFLLNSTWLLVFLFHMFYILFFGLHLKCWKGIYFSHYFYLLFNFLFLGLIINLHFWFRDLLREGYKKSRSTLCSLISSFSYLCFFLKLCYFYPSFGHPFIHHFHQVLRFGLLKVYMLQIL